MKKALKRILITSVILAALVLCLVFSASALDKTGQCGEDVYWSYDEATGELVISGSGAMYEYSRPMDNPFYSSDISSIVIESGVTTVSMDAFKNCYYVKNVSISDTVEDMGYPVFSYTNVESFTVDAANKKYSSDDSGVLFNKGKTALLRYPANNERSSYVIPSSVFSIDPKAFEGTYDLETVTISAGVETISADAFSGTNIEEFIVDKGNKYFSNDSYGVLYNKAKTALVRYTSGNRRAEYTVSSGVVNIMDNAFNNTQFIEKIILGSKVKVIGAYAFDSCYSLTSINIPDSVTQLGGSAFYHCESLPEITIPNGITQIAEDTFTACYKLSSVKLPDTVTSIGNRAFLRCEALESIKLPAGLKAIGQSSFSQTALTDIVIPHGTNTIDDSFNCCYKLATATLPVSLTSLSEAAFFECSKLTDVYYKGTESQWNKLNEYKSASFLAGVKIHFADSVVLEKPAKVSFICNASAIRVSWSAVEGATGYRIYRKSGDNWLVTVPYATGTSYTFYNLKAGQRYTLAVRPYADVNGSTVWGDYVTVNICTKAAAPERVVAAQNTSAIRLTWTRCEGATGYRIYYKSGSVWKVCLNLTTATTHTFYGLNPGAKYTFAIRPFIIIDGNVVWSDYTQFTTATKPAKPAFRVTSPSTGKISLTYGAVAGAEGYQIYYKTGNGGYKLLKTYTKTGTLSFSNLKSGTKYTFAIRAGIRTSGGNIFGGYNELSVTVK